MAVSLISSTESLQSTDSTTFTLSMPATRPDGDLYIAIVAKDDDIAFTTDLVAGSWTELYDNTGHATDGPRTGVWWKIGSSEPASYSFEADEEQWIGVVLRFSGFNSSDPIDGFTSTTGDGIPGFPAITPTQDDCYILRMFGIDSDNPVSGDTPAGHTWIEGGQSSASFGAGVAVISVDSPAGADVEQAAVSWGSLTDTYCGFSLAIAPAAGGALATASGVMGTMSGGFVRSLSAFRQLTGAW